MEAVAWFLGAHAFAMLIAATAVLLASMAGFWLLLQRYGKAGRQASLHLFGAMSRRVPRLSAVAALARFLGLEALVAFAVAVGAFAAFLELADELGFDEDLGKFDEALSDSLRVHVSPPMLALFAAVTRIGDVAFLAGLVVMVAIGLAWYGRWQLAAAWTVATALGGLLNTMLKALFERARPLHEHALVHAEGWSFPSGHASGAMLVYGLLGYLIAREAPHAWRLPVALAAALLVVLVGFSRVILQVHYFSDVLAGYASAGTWVAAWIAGIELARRRR
jgi:undecaprenyl-diphosphatase